MTLLAEQLCKRWMRGIREGNGRPAWQHPQDVARLVAECPSIPSAVVPYLEQVAWLHDVLEDGTHLDGTRVKPGHMFLAGVCLTVVQEVIWLTHWPNESKHEYLARLPKASGVTQIVKCCDRVCNLREGASVFSAERWARYVDETREFIVPLAQSWDDPPLRAWLVQQLESAMASRRAAS